MAPSWPTWKPGMVRAEGIEPSWPCGLRIFLPLRLSPPRQCGFVVWTIPSPFPTRGLGAARLVSTPSRKCFRAWLGIAIAGFPDFEQFYAVGFPMGTQPCLSPLRLPFRHARWKLATAHHKASSNDPRFVSQTDDLHIPTEKQFLCSREGGIRKSLILSMFSAAPRFRRFRVFVILWRRLPEAIDSRLVRYGSTVSQQKTRSFFLPVGESGL